MRPIYVKELFQLLEFIGVKWQTVANHLGAPRTPFSLWRHGRRPIAKEYAAPFIQYTIDVVDQALAKAKAEDVTTTHGPDGRVLSILGHTSTAVTFERDVRDLITEWEKELLHTDGRFNELTQKWCDVLLDLRAKGLDKSTEWELQRATYAAKQLYGVLSEEMAHRGEIKELEAIRGFSWSGRHNHDFTQHPTDRIRELARWAGVEFGETNDA
jgi:hypothetical protein